MAETHTLSITLLLFLDHLLLAQSTAVQSSELQFVLSDANVSCIVGEDCILPCSFRPAGPVVIHWYKQQIPVHSYYYSKDQFGLQNRHFSGRTSLFNSQIAHGNGSLLLRRVKMQDRGRYRCYTSTRKSNQEAFVSLGARAPIQSMILELTEKTFTCSTHNTFPAPRVSWSTDPPSADGALSHSTVTMVDSKGLFTVESTLRILGNLSNYTYFCSFAPAEESRGWTASWKKQDYIKEEEGRALSIPCIAPYALQNFSLRWTFASSSEPVVFLRYDTKTRRLFNVWEGRAELDPEQLLLSNASLLLPKPNAEEHSGLYTCTISGVQSKHIVQTDVNISASSVREGALKEQRSWWCTAASVGFFLLIVAVTLPRCVRHETAETAAARGFAGVLSAEVGLRGAECNTPQLPSEAQRQECALALLSGAKEREEEKPEEGPGGEKGKLGEEDQRGNMSRTDSPAAPTNTWRFGFNTDVQTEDTPKNKHAP